MKHTGTIISSFKICISAVHIILDKMNSTNWPAPNVWVFIAQMVEHCSANAEAIGSNPVEVPKTFFGFICNSLNCNNHYDDHIFIQNLYFRSSHHLHDLKTTASIAHFTNNVRLSQLCDLFKQQTTRSMGLPAL